MDEISNMVSKRPILPALGIKEGVERALKTRASPLDVFAHTFFPPVRA